MKLVAQTGAGRVVADLHALVTNWDNEVMMASLFGIDSVVRGVAAALVSSSARVYIDRHGCISPYWMDRVQKAAGSYRIITRPFLKEPGRNLVHCIVLHESCAAVELGSRRKREGEKEHDPVVVTLDGDIVKAVNRRIAIEHNLPNVPEWYEHIYSELRSRGHLKELKVDVHQDLGSLMPVSAVALDLETSDLVNIICRGLEDLRIMLPPGEVDAPPLKGYSSLAEYLKDYAPYLAAKIEKVAKPLHDINNDHLPAEITLMKRTPWPIQAHAATAVFKGIKLALKKKLRRRSFFLNCGDMGTGKSIIATTVMHLLYHHLGGARVLLVVPGITIPQWQKAEILPTLPYAKIRVIRNWKDTLRFIKETRGKKPDGLEIVIIGRDRAKLGHDPWTCVLWKRIRMSREYAWHCPDCYKPLPHPEEPDDYAGWEILAEGEPAEGSPLEGVRWKKDTPLSNALKKCPYCGAVLRRPANKALGETRLQPRIEPAWLMKRYLPKGHFDLMVVDEFHQFRGDSGRGASFASLVCISKIVLGLSGTPTTGRASSIYRILERTCMADLIEDGFQKGDIALFVRRYGRLQEITKASSSGGIHTRRDRSVKKTVRELPGIDPRVYVRYLFSSVFLDLKDIGIPLVELNEDVVFVELDKEHKKAYDDFHRKLDNACRRAIANGNRGAYAKFLPATLNYAVLPRRQEVVIGDDEEAEVVVSQDFPDDYYSAPERRLVEDVMEEISQGRRVMVYCYYTDKYAIDMRLKKVFADHGIEAAVLKSSVPDEERQDWIQQQVDRGIMVIIANMGLVEVGLNLITLPNMFFYQGNYQTEVVRQAAKRGHRFNQKKACKVRYYVPNGTQCVPQFENMVASRAQAMYLEGRLLADELARYTDGYNALVRDVSECLAGSEVADKWQELAAKDIDIKTISEAEFEAELAEAKERLVNLTKSLCRGELTSAQVQEMVAKMVEVAELSLASYNKMKKSQRRKLVPGQLFLDFGA